MAKQKKQAKQKKPAPWYMRIIYKITGSWTGWLTAAILIVVGGIVYSKSPKFQEQIDKIGDKIGGKKED